MHLQSVTGNTYSMFSEVFPKPIRIYYGSRLADFGCRLSSYHFIIRKQVVLTNRYHVIIRPKKRGFFIEIR